MKKNKEQFTDRRLPQPLVAGGVAIPVVPYQSTWVGPYPWWSYNGGWMGTVYGDDNSQNEDTPTEGAVDADGAVV